VNRYCASCDNCASAYEANEVCSVVSCSPGYGLSSSGTCSICFPGSYGDGTKPCSACASPQYSAARSASCDNSCVAGTLARELYTLAGNSCVLASCPAGQYSPSTGCPYCSTGNYCDGVNQVSCSSGHLATCSSQTACKASLNTMTNWQITNNPRNAPNQMTGASSTSSCYMVGTGRNCTRYPTGCR
jgi:hypothetical protein